MQQYAWLLLVLFLIAGCTSKGLTENELAIVANSKGTLQQMARHQQQQLNAMYVSLYRTIASHGYREADVAVLHKAQRVMASTREATKAVGQLSARYDTLRQAPPTQQVIIDAQLAFEANTMLQYHGALTGGYIDEGDAVATHYNGMLSTQEFLVEFARQHQTSLLQMRLYMAYQRLHAIQLGLYAMKELQQQVGGSHGWYFPQLAAHEALLLARHDTMIGNELHATLKGHLSLTSDDPRHLNVPIIEVTLNGKPLPANPQAPVRLPQAALAQGPVVVTTYTPAGQVVQVELTHQHLDTLSHD